MYEIEFYEDKNGKSKVADLKRLRKHQNAKLSRQKEICRIIWKGMNHMPTWKELKNELSFNQEDKNIIELEKDLIRTMVAIREEKGLTQSQLAEMCNMKQPVIARMESSAHSPQINSLLKVLTPLGYTLQIVPVSNKQ